MSARITVLFVCVHNAGRSQMAAGYLQHLAGDRVEVLSAGSQPADQVNQVAVRAMAEEGIDISAAQPRVLSAHAVERADVVITMGCGDACPYYPGKRYEDWQLADPAGQGLDAVRPIRDAIRGRVETLLREISPWVPAACSLPTSEQPLRVAEFDALFARHLERVERESDQTLRLELSGATELAGQVRDLAAREADCCSFFDFEVTAPSPGEVVVRVHVPEQHTAVLDALTETAARSAG